MKPTIPQGTRDFDAATVRKRNYIFNTIRNVFELYGYQPLETPAMENLDTLMGKYGEEGDKLIFRILDSGNPFSAGFFSALMKYLKANYDYLNFLKENVQEFKHSENPFNNPIFELNPEYLASVAKSLLDDKEKGHKWLSDFKFEVSSKALRYDLTIPFARYVAKNYNQLAMPFKRYQMQPVWRADRPQKGRYREFYQCDADVVGSNSLLNELELATIYATVFQKLNVPVEIRINNRKILAALASLCGGADKLTDITIAIDKLDKIGIEKVKEELLQRGLGEVQVKTIESFLNITGSNEEKLSQMKELFAGNEIGLKGIEELEYLNTRLTQSQILNSKFQIDLTLARGLNYYTGTIFEVKATGVQIGSIGGGGRYDDLTGLFGVPNVPGVGISFGVDRIYDVLSELNAFPTDVSTGTQLLFFNLGEAEVAKAFELAEQLRAAGIGCELYHENTKFDKQFKYAEKKNIPHVAILGSKELEQQIINVKNLATGEQRQIPFSELSAIKF